MAINNVLPPKAAQCDITANFKILGGPGHQRRNNFDGFIYIRYVVPPYLAGISAIYHLPFAEVRVPFADHVQ